MTPGNRQSQIVKFFTNQLRPPNRHDILAAIFGERKNKTMKKSFALLIVTGLAASLPMAQAADVSGKITLKGTPPAEKVIAPLKEDPNCGKLRTEVPTTHFFVVGAGGELADVIVSLQGPTINGKSTGAAAAPVTLDQKGCEYVPSILAV